MRSLLGGLCRGRGQDHVKRVREIAAAGGHNLDGRPSRLEENHVDHASADHLNLIEHIFFCQSVLLESHARL